MQSIILSGFGVHNIPFVSYGFYESSIPDGVTRIVLKTEFFKEIPSTEIVSWLKESISHGVVCCRFLVDKKDKIQPFYLDDYTAALYFDNTDDVVMFKLAFHDIIHDIYVTGDRESTEKNRSKIEDKISNIRRRYGQKSKY